MKQFGILVAVLLLLAATASPGLAVKTTIYDIQNGLHALGDEVTVDSVVVTATAFYGFFVQHVDPHPLYQRTYSGIFVHTHGFHLGDVKRGDLVNVTGGYDEYFDFSEIDLAYLCGPDVACEYEIIGTATVPDPVEVTIEEVHTGGPFAEAYESVLIRVDRVDPELTAGPVDINDDWALWHDVVGAGTDSLMVDQYSADPNGDFTYTPPAEGTVLDFVQGVLVYNYDNFKIAPRNCPEDLGMDCPPVLMGVWTYDNSHVDCKFAVAVDEASAETIDHYAFDSGLAVLAADRDETNHSLVHLTTSTHNPGYVDIAYVDGVVSDGAMVPMPDAEYTFTQGIMSLYQIQYVDDLTTDESEYLDYLVTIEGRVTQTNGNYYFLQEGDCGPFQHLYSRVSKVGDVAIGDSVRVAGEVREYYGLTELGFRSGVQLFENLGPTESAVVVTDLDPSEAIYDAAYGDQSPPDDNLPEKYESALVRINATAHIDSVDGAGSYGEWWMTFPGGSPEDTCLVDFLDADVNEDGSQITYVPAVGDSLLLTGILQYSFSRYRLVPRTDDDIEVVYSAGVGDPYGPLSRVVLRQNRPNPFARGTAFQFELAEPARAVAIEIFDVTGACVRHLMRTTPLEAGTHTAAWNGRSDRGAPLEAGTYFYRLTVDGRSQARQMIRLN